MKKRQKKKNIQRKWEEILRKDQQWDQAFLYTILAFKLKLMADFFEGPDTYSLGASAIAQDIRRAAVLADRLAEKDYVDEVPYTDQVIALAVQNGGFPAELQEKADLDELMDLMKNSLNWWD